MRPQLEYAVQAWSPWLQKDIEVLERVQKRMVSLIPNLRGNNYEAKLHELGIKTLKYRRDRADMLTVYRWIRGIDNINVSEMFEFYRDTDRNTRVADYEWNIVPRRSRTEVRANTFTTRVATKWNQLPVQVKSSPSLSSFKTNYDTFQATQH